MSNVAMCFYVFHTELITRLTFFILMPVGDDSFTAEELSALRCKMPWLARQAHDWQYYLLFILLAHPDITANVYWA